MANPEIEKGRVKRYTVQKGEEGVYHVELERTEFDNEGNKKSTPFVQKYDPRTWQMVERNLSALGYNYVRVLHDPKADTKKKAAATANK